MSDRVALTTIVRAAPVDRPSGWLRIVSLESGTQEAMAPLPDAVHRARDPNPRGGLRGGRGIAATADRLAVAINDRILVLDRCWRLTGVLSHRWMGGLHDLAADAQGLWATCADNDLVLRLDWQGQLQESWHWRGDRRMRRMLGHRFLPSFDRWADHRDPFGGGLRVDVGHVNAVATDGDRLFVGLGLVRGPASLWWPLTRARGLRLARRVGLGVAASRAVAGWRASPAVAIGRRFGAGPELLAITPGNLHFQPAASSDSTRTWAVVELERSRRAWRCRLHARLVTREASGGLPTHNVVPGDGLIMVNDSPNARVLAIDRATGEIVRSVTLPGDRPFPRGLVRVGDGRLLVGTQRPLALSIVDLESGRIDERILLPHDRGESTYAVAALPGGFSDPDGRLPVARADWGIVGADASRPA